MSASRDAVKLHSSTSSSTFAVNFPGVRSPVSLTVTDSPDGAAFLGTVWTLRSDTGAWLCQHTGPPLAQTTQQQASSVALPWPQTGVPSLLRQLFDAFLPALGLVAFPLPHGARVRGLFLTPEDAWGERQRLLKLASRTWTGLPRRRTLARPTPNGRDGRSAVQQVLVDGAVVDSPEVVRRTVSGATPHSVSLSTAAALASSPPCTQQHEQRRSINATVTCVPDAIAVRDAVQLLRARSAQSTPSAQPLVHDFAASLPPPGADAMLDALPVFSVPSMVIGLPSVDGTRALFRPWFLSKRCLDAVLAWAHREHVRHVLRLRAASRRSLAVATARGAAFLRAVAFGEELPPFDDGGGISLFPPSQGGGEGRDEGGDDEGDSLEDGGVDDTDALVKDYMQDLLGSSHRGDSLRGALGDDDGGDDGGGGNGRPGTPQGGVHPVAALLSKLLFPWMAFPPSTSTPPAASGSQSAADDGSDDGGGKHHGTGLRIELPSPAHAAAAAAISTALAFAAVTLALAAPAGDAIDSMLARTAPGRRLLLTGKLIIPRGKGPQDELDAVLSGDDITVSTWQRVREEAAQTLAEAQKQRRSSKRRQPVSVGGDSEPEVIPDVLADGSEEQRHEHDDEDDSSGGDGVGVPTPEELDKVARPLFVGDLGLLGTQQRK